MNSAESCSGKAKNDMGEARMDIEDSEIAYLGYHKAESYGLSWKVGGRGGRGEGEGGERGGAVGGIERWTLDTAK